MCGLVICYDVCIHVWPVVYERVTLYMYKQCAFVCLCVCVCNFKWDVVTCLSFFLSCSLPAGMPSLKRGAVPSLPPSLPSLNLTATLYFSPQALSFSSHSFPTHVSATPPPPPPPPPSPPPPPLFSQQQRNFVLFFSTSSLILNSTDVSRLAWFSVLLPLH